MNISIVPRISRKRVEMAQHHGQNSRGPLRVFAMILLMCSVDLILPKLTVLHAQTNVGRISGTVLDSSGAAVPGCRVATINTGTTQRLTTETDAAGLYVF